VTTRAPTAAGATSGELDTPAANRALLEVTNLQVRFRVNRRTFVEAVRNVSFDLHAGETLALVGESGSGKSTIGRAVVGLVVPTSGTVRFDGTDLATATKQHRRQLGRDLAVVFQDPYSSLDPSMRIRDIIAEPVRAHSTTVGDDLARLVDGALENVGLHPELAERRPHALSGGQRQRVAIARATILGPRLVVYDEPLSALDVSTQAQVLNLLERLQEHHRSANLFISHNLGVVHHIAHRIAVLYLGATMEIGPAERIFARPAHPYSRALLDAIPILDPDERQRRNRILLQGEMPSATELTTGCPFQSRCPQVMDICRRDPPPMVPVPGGGQAACHLLA
jgi:oligopeptide/dipeptide ABC transporter ATP-binding protein